MTHAPKKSLRKHVTTSLLSLSLALLSLPVFAAPYSGKSFDLKQPDGSLVPVLVYGDEFYQRVESPQGYTLVRDSNGWICYAELNATATDLVSTGIRYNGPQSSSKGVSFMAVPLEQHITLPVKVIREKARQAEKALNADSNEAAVSTLRRAATSNADPVVRIGNIKGLTLLVEFGDSPATIPQTDLDNLCNLPGYKAYDNKGSVRDYFFDVSGKKLEYTNYVTAYYKAKNDKSYYDSPDLKDHSTAHELVLEALTDLKDHGFDFSSISTDSQGNVLALNVLYAGKATAGWSKGLWPHAGSLSKDFKANGVKIKRYQITNIEQSPSIGTFVHESGHLLCHWKDLYDYDHDSKGVGHFDVMASVSDDKNPVPPNAYYRELCGWEVPTDITNIPPGTVLRHVMNSNSSFRYKNPEAPNEFFMIESRKKKGRNKTLPAEGLMIWHIDTEGDRNSQEMTPSSHYYVSLEQADGKYHLEHNKNGGDSKDLFDGIVSTSFTDTTVPDSSWWSGYDSGLRITNISPFDKNATEMSFTFGESPTIDVDVTLEYDDAPKDNAVNLTVEVTNQGESDLDLSQYEIVYYLYEPNLNADESVWDTYYCNYTDINATVQEMSQPFTTTQQKADKELVLSFPTGTMLSSSRTLHIQGALHATNWGHHFDESDDWSHTNEGLTESVVIIEKSTGNVVYGKAPTGL
jgi:M6 family metalloprotease-like protein